MLQQQIVFVLSLTCLFSYVQGQSGGPATNLTVANITHNSAYLWWDEPLSAENNNNFTQYLVILVPPIDGSPFNTTDTELYLDDLLPAYRYSVTVVAVFNDDEEYNTSVSFATIEGPPEFATPPAITPVNGNITFSWKLRHTGGQDYTTITVRGYCSPNMDYMFVGSGASGSADGMMPNSDNTLVYNCASRCIDTGNLEGGTSLGPVTAGTRYYCSFVVSNNLGDATENRNVIPVQGKPSKPIIIVSSNDQGSINVVIRCQYTGVILGQSAISFSVLVRNEMGNATLNTYSPIGYVNNTHYGVNINVPGDQLYTVEVFAFNQYGNSELVISSPVNVTAVTSLPPIGTEPETRLLIIIIAASVGGLIIIVVFISIIICICACCCKRKRTRGTVTFTSNINTWKREQSKAAKLEMSQRKRH